MRLKSAAFINEILYFNSVSKKFHISPAALEFTPSPVSIATLGAFIWCARSLPKSAPLSTMPVFTAFIFIWLLLQASLTVFHKSLPNAVLPFLVIITEPLPKFCVPMVKGVSVKRILIPFASNPATVFADETPCQRMTYP